MANQTLQKKLNSDKKWLKAKCLKLSVNITMEDSVNTNIDVKKPCRDEKDCKHKNKCEYKHINQSVKINDSLESKVEELNNDVKILEQDKVQLLNIIESVKQLLTEKYMSDHKI